MTAFYAENTINTRASGVYEYNIVFDGDGIKGKHYTVIRTTSSMPGNIYVKYDADRHELYVETTNIQKLEIDCRSIAEEKTKEILGKNYNENKNYYKTYFVEEVQIFYVTVIADHDILLTFEDVPYPSMVKVNNIELKEDEDYIYDDGDIKNAKAEEGESEVEIHFGSTSSAVSANFVTDKKGFHHLVNTNIEFDPSSSSGNILDYIWDFGDGNYETEMDPVHSYREEGNYDVILVVRDGNGDIDRVIKTIYINDTDSDGLPDGWEIDYFGNIDRYNDKDDPDKDKLDNEDEYRYNTDPTRSDTDNDGWSDFDEINAGTDPNDRSDKPKEEEEDDGMFGLGKVGDIDVFLILLLFIIIIIIVIAAGSVKRKTRALEEEELEEEEEEEEEEIEEEEEEAYECPECGAVIHEDQPECDECGATLEWEEEEEEELEEPGGDLEAEEMEEEEIAAVEEGIEEEAGEAGEEAEEFECPTCGGVVTEDDEICPTCGEEFED